MSSDELWQAAAHLCTSVGFGGGLRLQPLIGGANNRVFRVHVPGACVLLKEYFQHADDPRDRLATEFAFASFAWDNGVRVLPRPLACDAQRHLGLYEFVQGRQVLPQDITSDMIRQALAFYHDLNQCRWVSGARALPTASEACFSIADHLGCVERRLQRLRGIDQESLLHSMAARFVRDELSAAWRKVVDAVHRQASELGVLLADVIPSADRCLSPSDFGFHNALLADDGLLRFIDFEYAGWDDPGKMVCDFFCQQAVPVPLAYYDTFVAAVVSDLSDPEWYRQRIALLLPVYKIKWCCIMLNDFLPLGSARRRFAHRDVEQKERQAAQLEKTRHFLQSLR
jgi:hypothetical protein